ncbi:hypothetical protein P9112_006481 [Eukaryota sp. TZLM1-RC]
MNQRFDRHLWLNRIVSTTFKAIPKMISKALMYVSPHYEDIAAVRQVGRSQPAIRLPFAKSTNSTHHTAFNSTSHRFPTCNNKPLEPNHIGPGSYDNCTSPNPSFSEHGYGPLCSRSKRFRKRKTKSAEPYLSYSTSSPNPPLLPQRPTPTFIKPSSSSLIPQSEESPSPADYNPNHLGSKSQSRSLSTVSFKSSTLRASFTDTAALDTPDPTSYNVPSSTGSRVSRTQPNRPSPGLVLPNGKQGARRRHGIFPKAKEVVNNPGPGSYNVEKGSHNRRWPCFVNTVGSPKKESGQSINQTPGPWSYDPLLPSKNSNSYSFVFKSKSKDKSMASNSNPSSCYYKPIIIKKKSFRVPNDNRFFV